MLDQSVLKEGSVSPATHARVPDTTPFPKSSHKSVDFSKLFVASKVHWFRRTPSRRKHGNNAARVSHHRRPNFFSRRLAADRRTDFRPHRAPGVRTPPTGFQRSVQSH